METTGNEVPTHRILALQPAVLDPALLVTKRNVNEFPVERMIPGLAETE
jgi:hypothetical protein